jgi:hypothetical protein
MFLRDLRYAVPEPSTVPVKCGKVRVPAVVLFVRPQTFHQGTKQETVAYTGPPTLSVQKFIHKSEYT